MSLRLWAQPGCYELHYAIGLRVIPLGSPEARLAPSCSFRLTSAPEPGAATVGASQAIELPGDQAIEQLHFAVCRTAMLDAPGPGVACVSLFGRASGVAVTWIAASLIEAG